MRRARRRREAAYGLAFLAPAMVILGIVYVYPIAAVIASTFRARGSGAWSGLTNYGHLFGDEVFRAAVVNNVLLLTLIPIMVALAVSVASILHEAIRGWRAYRVLVFLPYMIPVVVAGFLFSNILQGHGLLNSILRSVGLGGLASNWLGDPSLALPSVSTVIVWRELGFGVILFLARMAQLPSDMFDAAKVDGANRLQILVHITIPQLGTVIAFYCAVMMIELFSWVFNYVFVLTRGGPGFSTYVSEYFIYDRAFAYNELGTAAVAASLLALASLVGMYFYVGWLRRRGLF